MDYTEDEIALLFAARAELREQCGDGDDEIKFRLSSRMTFSNIEMLCRCDPRLVKTWEGMGLAARTKAKGKKGVKEG
jgi:hypothetical protein